MEPQNLMALGDGENDVEMLQVCFPVLPHLQTPPYVTRMLVFACNRSHCWRQFSSPTCCRRSKIPCLECEEELSLS